MLNLSGKFVLYSFYFGTEKKGFLILFSESLCQTKLLLRIQIRFPALFCNFLLKIIRAFQTKISFCKTLLYLLLYLLLSFLHLWVKINLWDLKLLILFEKLIIGEFKYFEFLLKCLILEVILIPLILSSNLKLFDFLFFSS